MDLLFSLLIIAVILAFFESRFGKSTKSDGTQDATGTTSTKVSVQPESQVTRRLMDGRSKGESPPKRPSPPVRSTTAGRNQIGAGLQRDSSADQQRSSVLIESRAKTYSRKFPNIWRRVERLTTEVLGSEVAVASSSYGLQFSGEQITRMVGHLDREFEIEIDKTRSVIAKSGTTVESRAIASAPLHSVESLFVAVVECLSPDGEKNGVIGWFEDAPMRARFKRDEEKRAAELRRMESNYLRRQLRGQRRQVPQSGTEERSRRMAEIDAQFGDDAENWFHKWNEGLVD